MKITAPAFSALRHGTITMHLITEENLPTLLVQLEGTEEGEELQEELSENYIPRYDDEGNRMRWGFYATVNDELMGFSLLDVDSVTDKRASTGADTLPNHRGKGIAPGSKPHLFYLAFQILGLNRIDTGCLVSNHASQRSLEKTPGFVFEGIAREFEWNPDVNAFEDVRLYGMLRRDWETLYANHVVEVIA